MANEVDKNLYFACEQVVCCARGGDGIRVASKDEVVITLKVFQMVIDAIKKAEATLATLP
jgi:hypothetical protein